MTISFPQNSTQNYWAGFTVNGLAYDPLVQKQADWPPDDLLERIDMVYQQSTRQR